MSQIIFCYDVGLFGAEGFHNLCNMYGMPEPSNGMEKSAVDGKTLNGLKSGILSDRRQADN